MRLLCYLWVSPAPVQVHGPRPEVSAFAGEARR